MLSVLLRMVWLLCVPRLYCESIVSEVKYTWEEANTFCTGRSAHLVPSDTVGKMQPKPPSVVWTSNSFKIFQSHCTVQVKPLCKFQFMNQSMGYDESFALYGDCDVPHYYMCKYGDRKPVLKTGTHDEAIQCASNHISSLAPGYYWLEQKLFYCPNQTLGESNVTHQVLKSFCGVYGEGFGQAFVQCSQPHFALCKSASSVSPHDHSSLGLGVKLGVPMGVCVVLICGVIAVVVYVRRRHRNHDKRGRRNEENDKTGKGKSRLCNNGMYALQHLGQTESGQYIGNTVRAGTDDEQGNPETNGDYECLDEREVRNINRENESESKSGRDKTHHSSLRDLDNTGYCFAVDVRPTSNQTNNECNDPNDHVYNCANEGDGEYDSIANKRQAEIKPDNVYNHMSHDIGMDSDYDSTIPRKLMQQQQGLNDVYNTLSGDGYETNGYDLTESSADTKCAEIEDNTYNTLRDTE